MDTLNTANISDNRFSRFDKELIDKYFNEAGKKAIQEHIKSEIQKESMRRLAAEMRCEQLEAELKPYRTLKNAIISEIEANIEKYGRIEL